MIIMKLIKNIKLVYSEIFVGGGALKSSLKSCHNYLIHIVF